MRPDISPWVAVGPAMVMLPEGVLPGACLLRFPSINTKLFGEAAHVRAVLSPGVLLTLVKFKLNSVPEPDSGVALVEKAEMRNVLPPIMFALTFQLDAVRPAGDAGVPWKVTTDGSNVKSPWKPLRSSVTSMFDVVTGSVKFVVLVLMLAIGKETVATVEGVTRLAEAATPTPLAELPGSGFARLSVKSPLMSPITSAL